MTIEQVKQEAKRRFHKDLTDEEAQAYLHGRKAERGQNGAGIRASSGLEDWPPSGGRRHEERGK